MEPIDTQNVTPAPEQPQTGRWRRVAMFPLIRILLALLVMNVIALPLSFLVPSSALVVRESILAAAAVMGLLFVGRVIERREPKDFGLATVGGLRDVAIGFLVGAVIMSLVVAVLAAGGWYRVTSIGVKGLTGAHFPIALLLFLMVGVFEEVLFRAIVFRISEEGLGSILALVLSSLIFGLVHLGNDNASLVAGVAIALEAGVLLSAVYMFTRSVWMAVGIHWSWNFFEGPVFGTPVSGNRFLLLIESELRGPTWLTGGAFGPEAGIVALVVATGTGIYFLKKAKDRRGLVPPAWRRQEPSPPEQIPIGSQPS